MLKIKHNTGLPYQRLNFCDTHTFLVKVFASVEANTTSTSYFIQILSGII